MNFHAKILQCVLWSASEPPVSVTNLFHTWALFCNLVTASSMDLGLPYFAEVCPSVSSKNVTYAVVLDCAFPGATVEVDAWGNVRVGLEEDRSLL